MTTQPKTRDHLLVRLINGATKAGVRVDRRKEHSRRACRRRIRVDARERGDER